jgi:hypothetical protein
MSELFGFHAITTGPIRESDGKDHIAFWQWTSKGTLYIRSADIYLSGVMNATQDLYAYAKIRETNNLIVAGCLAAYTNAVQDRWITKNHAPDFIPLEEGQHIDLTYYGLWLDGEPWSPEARQNGLPLYKPEYQQGMHMQLFLWATREKP